MDHQTLLPPPEGAPFEWLRECLETAWPAEEAGTLPRQLQRNASATAGPDPRSDFRPQITAFPPEIHARRADERSKMSLYRSATLRWDGKEGLCLIRNVSAGGMMCRSMAELAEGMPVEIELRSGVCITGVVIWAHDGQFGLRFDQRVDVAALLNPVGRSDAPVQRMPRLRAGCGITLVVEGKRRDATLLDLSQGGAKIEAACLCEGNEVTLGIAGLEPRRGIVRWAQRSQAGIAFHNPIPFNALARWAVTRPDN